MGFSELFGFGKKEKIPFKTPQEVTALRTRISAENRENFPSMARYKEIKREAERVQEKLAAIIKEQEYAEEASRIRDDIRQKVEALEAKIDRNMQGSKKEGNQDYVEKNIDYLERKSTRDKAKTLFTEFLEAVETITRACGSGSGAGSDLNGAIQKIVRTMSELQLKFFAKHGSDKEINKLREDILKKIYELNVLVQESSVALNEKGLAGKMEMGMNRIMSIAKHLSEQ